MGGAPWQTDTAPAVQPMQGEESVGENTFGSTIADDAADGVTSPGQGLHCRQHIGSHIHKDAFIGNQLCGSGALMRFFCAGLKVDRLVGGNAQADPEAGANAEASWVSSQD